MENKSQLMALVGVLTAVLGFSSLAWAQAKPIKGEVVYLNVPMTLFKEKILIWKVQNSLTALVKPTAAGVSINGEENWQTMGFPPMTEHKVLRVKQNSSSKDWPQGSVTVELEWNTDFTLRFYFPNGHLTRLFSMVFASKDEVDQYRQQIYKNLAAQFFDGTPLAGLSDEQKNTLCMFANVTANGTKMGSVVYKDNLYLV